MKCIVALSLLLAALPAAAERLDLPTELPTVTVIAMPTKGSSMDAVAARFGQPQQRHPAAGGDSPRHPPITRWDYPGFSVFFENRHVVHTVRPDAPAPIARRDGLIEAP